MSKFVSTRGFFDTVPDITYAGVEAQTDLSMWLPRGCTATSRPFWHGFSAATGITDTINILRAAWAYKLPSGSKTIGGYLTFGGSNTANVAAGAIVESDAIGTALPPGSRLWTRTWYRCALSGTKLPTRPLFYVGGGGALDGNLSGAYGSMSDHMLLDDFDHTGATFPTGLLYQRSWGPAGVVGDFHPSWTGSVLVPGYIGDSRFCVDFDIDNGSTGFEATGMCGRFCAQNIPYMTWAREGSGHVNFDGQVGNADFLYFMNHVDVIYNEYGINDYRQSLVDWRAAFEGNRTSMAALCASYSKHMYQSTLTPCGRAVMAPGITDPQYALWVSYRAAANDWVRAHSNNTDTPGCYGYWDANTAVEDVLNSNNWLSGMNYVAGSDLLHQSTAGHIAEATTMNFPEAYLPPSSPPNQPFNGLPVLLARS